MNEENRSKEIELGEIKEEKTPDFRNDVWKKFKEHFSENMVIVWGFSFILGYCLLLIENPDEFLKLKLVDKVIQGTLFGFIPFLILTLIKEYTDAGLEFLSKHLEKYEIISPDIVSSSDDTIESVLALVLILSSLIVFLEWLSIDWLSVYWFSIT